MALLQPMCDRPGRAIPRTSARWHAASLPSCRTIRLLEPNNAAPVKARLTPGMLGRCRGSFFKQTGKGEQRAIDGRAGEKLERLGISAVPPCGHPAGRRRNGSQQRHPGEEPTHRATRSIILQLYPGVVAKTQGRGPHGPQRRHDAICRAPAARRNRRAPTPRSQSSVRRPRERSV